MSAAAAALKPSHYGWNPSPTKPGWWFIGNTSSDEMTGHFFGLSVFLDVSSRNDKRDRARARALMTDMITRIVRDGLTLMDVDGVTPTRWGHWAPRDLNDCRWGLGPDGACAHVDERGLRAREQRWRPRVARIQQVRLPASRFGGEGLLAVAREHSVPQRVDLNRIDLTHKLC